MDRKEAEQKQITLYWWNLGTKTLDFKGTYKEFLSQKGFKISNILFPKDKKIKGLRLKYPLNTITFTIDSYDSDVINAFDMAIKTYLTYLGDKATFKNCYGNKYKINWW